MRHCYLYVWRTPYQCAISITPYPLPLVMFSPLPFLLTHPPTSLDFDLDREAPATDSSSPPPRTPAISRETRRRVARPFPPLPQRLPRIRRSRPPVSPAARVPPPVHFSGGRAWRGRAKRRRRGRRIRGQGSLLLTLQPLASSYSRRRSRSRWGAPSPQGRRRRGLLRPRSRRPRCRRPATRGQGAPPSLFDSVRQPRMWMWVPHASLSALFVMCCRRSPLTRCARPWRGAAAAQGRFSPPLLSRFEILGWVGLPHVLTCFPVCLLVAALTHGRPD